jgi:hypothetical protein
MKDSDRATVVLRRMIKTLMETGVKRHDIITALDTLSAETRRDDRPPK